MASALLEEFTVHLLPAGTNVDLITASRQDAMVGDGSGVDSVGIYSGMGGVCRLAVASGQICPSIQMGGYGGAGAPPAEGSQTGGPSK